MDETEQQDIEIILEFLRRFAPGVTGRGEAPSEELEVKIDRFAKGQLDGNDRRPVAIEILQNIEAIEMLAERIKQLSVT